MQYLVGSVRVLKQCSETSEIIVLLKKALQIVRFIFTYDCVWVFCWRFVEIARGLFIRRRSYFHSNVHGFCTTCMLRWNVVFAQTVQCKLFFWSSTVFDAVLLLFTSVQQCIRICALCTLTFAGLTVCNCCCVFLAVYFAPFHSGRRLVGHSIKRLVDARRTSSVLGRTRLDKIWWKVKTNRSWYIR